MELPAIPIATGRVGIGMRYDRTIAYGMSRGRLVTAAQKPSVKRMAARYH